MKKIILNSIPIAIAIGFVLNLYAQVPQKLSYQAVIRNNNNNLVVNQTIGIQISILKGAINGPAVYVEKHTPITNANGLISIEIGNGTVISGSFVNINWADGPYFIKTEVDPTGGENYTITGTGQVLSVPYALYAKVAESLTGEIIEKDPLFKSSMASTITSDDTAKWNSAYRWGNHAGLYRPSDWLPTWEDIKNKPTEITFSINPMSVYTNDTIYISKRDGCIELITDKPSAGNKAYIPLNLPCSIGFVNKKLKSVSIEYWNDAANCYINTTEVIEYGDFGVVSYKYLIRNFELRNVLQKWTTYTIVPTTPVEFSNHIEICLHLSFGNPPAKIKIRNIWVTLTE